MYFLLNATFILLAVLQSSVVSSLGLSPFSKKLSSDFFFFFNLFWLGLACELTKTVIDTSEQCGKEVGTEVVNTIISGPCMD